MNEFSLIQQYFNVIKHHRHDVVFGIGDDAACLDVPHDMSLLVSTDTLVSGVHFLMDWDAYDIASRAVRVTVSDMAAMAATPCWMTLALTMPVLDEPWLQRFSQGLQDTLSEYHIALVGGDTTRGPMAMTLTVHGFAPRGQAVRRSGAKVGDFIVVSGALGTAAFALNILHDKQVGASDRAVLMRHLLHPQPRIDLIGVLRDAASAAIDISDGLSADLSHILDASQVGACLTLESIPVHPLVQRYQPEKALDLALNGGDDYELCFTVPPAAFQALNMSGLNMYCIGIIEFPLGLRAKTIQGDIVSLPSRGYSHF